MDETFKSKPIITLLTDFGTKDGYVGAMKGVILRLCPQATIVDITHDISPQNIVEGAFVLKNFANFYPVNTIHIAVVDPGVGSKRKGIVIDTGNFRFIGPDNGLFTFILKEHKEAKIFELKAKKYFLDTIHPTFHGRDIFAPTAAHLALGVSPSKMGDPVASFETLHFPDPLPISEQEVKGTIIHIDHFGNLITNITKEFIKEWLKGKRKCEISICGMLLPEILTYYSEVPPGEVVALFGSSNFLEISVNRGNASKKLCINLNDSFTLKVVSRKS